MMLAMCMVINMGNTVEGGISSSQNKAQRQGAMQQALYTTYSGAKFIHNRGTIQIENKDSSALRKKPIDH